MYLTYAITKTRAPEQMDLFEAIWNNKPYQLQNIDKTPYTEYQTIQTDKIVPTQFNKTQVELLKNFIKNYAEQVRNIRLENIDSHYTSFRIPKHSGGFRQIDAPDNELKSLLTIAKNYLQDSLKIHPHNSAFAYVKNRCSKHALEKHQHNESRWFLHLDLKDFFSNCTEAFIHQQLKQIFPFSEMYKEAETITYMGILVKSALYKGRLPQGTPLSPYLTNIIMIPIDMAIYNLCKQWNKQHFIYTRYADDIDISSKYEFDYKKLLAEINSILAKQSPLQINSEKVHYGSNAGRNWHLGLMLNQQNQITVGYKKKRLLKQKLINFCNHKSEWLLDDIQTFMGELAYFKNIEPEYHDYLIETYSNKYNSQYNIIENLKELLTQNSTLNA